MRAWRASRRILIGGLLLLPLATPAAGGSGTLSLGTARGIRGAEVSLDRGRSWLPLGPSGLPLLDGAELRVAAGGTLLDLTGGGQLRVLPFSAIRVRETNGAAEVSLRYGRVTFHLPAGAPLAILTPTARLAPEPGQVTAGELFVGSDGTMGLRLSRGRARVAELAGPRRTMLASLEPVFLPERPRQAGPLFATDAPAAPAAGARPVFSPKGESLGYLAPGGRLVVHPGYSADLTGPVPRPLVTAALAKVPSAHRDAATPLFDVGGGYLGYLAGPAYYAQAVGASGAPASVEVVVVRAPAEIVPRGQTAAQPLVRGARLAEGDRVRTGRGGAAELRLGDGSLVRVGELSDFEIERLENDAAGAPRRSRFNLPSGKVRAFVARTLVAKVASDQGDFSIRTPTLVAAVRQTDFAVVQQLQGPGNSYTLAGGVQNTGVGGGAALCGANTYTQVPVGGNPSSCAQIPPADLAALQQELPFETPPPGPGGPGVAGGVGALAVMGGLFIAAENGAFSGGGGPVATALRPLR
ncbi:MAG TPA: FecR family protein [Methylomirabilota bacterium]|jgi:hypothetical protein|nr:FecR family protein [Methylomirabilota bacterium]